MYVQIYLHSEVTPKDENWGNFCFDICTYITIIIKYRILLSMKNNYEFEIFTGNDYKLN